MALKARKEIADYISAGKEDRARIRVEHIIREDYLVEAMELLEMYCDLILTRFGLIQTQKDIDPGLEESIASIIWASPRLQADVQELKSVTNQFAKKYGQDFAQECRGNTRSNVSEKVIHKLSVHAPPKALVEHYMVEIAKSYNIPFNPLIPHNDDYTTAVNLLADNYTDKRNHGKGAGGGGYGGSQPYNYTTPTMTVAHYTFSASPGSTGPHDGFNGYPKIPPIFNSAPANPSPQHFDHLDAPPKPARMTGPSTAHSQGANGVFPELPTVPKNLFPDISNSVGGREDVNFDELNKRFEDLKKKK